MEKNIKLNGRELKYELRLKRMTRRLRLAVYRDGRFVVSAPCQISENAIERFINQKAEWIIKKIDFFKMHGNKPGLLGTRNRLDFQMNKLKARRLILERIRHFNVIYKFDYGKISVRDQRTRWGSCSKRGNLNFSYKLVHLQARLADYIIVHELCHLKEFNHSPRFWALVGKSFPDYKQIRKELKVE